MFKRVLKWLKKVTTKKEDAAIVVKKKLYDGYAVTVWDREAHDVRISDTFATRESALERAKYLKIFNKDVVITDQYGEIVEML